MENRKSFEMLLQRTIIVAIRFDFHASKFQLNPPAKPT